MKIIAKKAFVESGGNQVKEGDELNWSEERARRYPDHVSIVGPEKKKPAAPEETPEKKPAKKKAEED